MLLPLISLLSYNYPFFCCLKLIYYPIVHCLSEVVYMEEYILKTFKTIKKKDNNALSTDISLFILLLFPLFFIFFHKFLCILHKTQHNQYNNCTYWECRNDTY